jgi:hypothetical protein
MVDVLSARLQDLYTKWESRNNPRLLNQTSAPRVSYGGLWRYGYQERHRKRALAREVSREVRENLENLHGSDVGVNKQLFWGDIMCM